MYTNEIWKDITNYEGFYQISNKGRLRSCKRKIKQGRGFRYSESKILKVNINRNGYEQKVLKKNGTEKTVLIHRLVAQEFLSNPLNKPQVNHKDGNKLNNTVNNLEWVTSRENIQHAFKNNLSKINFNLQEFIEKNSIAVKAYKNNELVGSYNNIAEAARELNLDKSTISKILNGKRKSTKGYTFEKL